jgi:hypothetical protein
MLRLDRVDRTTQNDRKAEQQCLARPNNVITHFDLNPLTEFRVVSIPSMKIPAKVGAVTLLAFPIP